MKKALAMMLAVIMALSMTLTASAAENDSAKFELADKDEEFAEAQAHKGGKLVMGTTPIGEFFNPYKQGTLVGYGWAVFEPLAYMYDDGTWEPCIAESWERDDENFTLTVHLRDDVKFSGGESLTADDVVFSHAARFEYGTASTIGNPVSVEKIDESTVQFKWADFSLNYEMWVLGQYIYSKSKFEEKGLDWILNNMYGTGPYVQTSFIPDVELKFARNENYWKDVTPPYDEIEWILFADNNAMLASFLNGEIGRVTASNDADRMVLNASGYEETFTKLTAEMQYIFVPLSTDESDPFYDVNVRRAVYLHGVDWDSMAAVCGGMTGFHTDSLGATGMGYYKDSIEQSEYDLELAKKELADAGYPDGFKTQIYAPGMMATMATYLQAELEKLGIEAEIITVDYSVVQSDYISSKAATTGICCWALSNPATNQLDRFIKHMNYTATCGGSSIWTDEIKELWDKTPTSMTLEEQNENLYNYVERYVITDSNIWPAYNTAGGYFYANWLKFGDHANVSGSGSGYNPFYIWNIE